MNISEKIFGFSKREKSEIDKHILKSTVFHAFLYLRILVVLLSIIIAYKAKGSYDLTYTSFAWIKFLAIYLLPEVIMLPAFYISPGQGINIIHKISGLRLVVGLLIILSSARLISLLALGLLLIDSYLCIRSKLLARKFCAGLPGNWGLFWRIAVLSVIVAYLGQYAAMRAYFSDVAYVKAQGEVLEGFGMFSPDNRYYTKGTAIREVGKDIHYIDIPLYGKSKVFSPDSKYLAITGKPEKGQVGPGIAIIEVEQALLTDRTNVPLGSTPADLKIDFPQDLLGDNVVLAMAFSPDGRYFACETEKAVILWELGTRKVYKLLTREFLHKGVYYQTCKTQIVFSADSKKLLTSASSSGEHTDGKLLIWDVEDKQLFKSIDIGKTDIAKIKFSQDGSRLVLLLEDSPDNKLPQYQGIATEGQNAVIFWDITADRMEKYIYDNAGAISFMDYSPDGQYVATASKGQYLVTIWDAAAGRKIKVLKPQVDAVPEEISYSPDGKYLDVYSTQSAVYTERLKRDGF